MRRFLTLMLCASWLFASAQVPDYVPTDGLVAWYPLDGDVDDKVGAADANEGSCTWGVGRTGAVGDSAAFFDGLTQSLLGDASVMPQTTRTVSVWLKDDSAGFENGFFWGYGGDGPASSSLFYIGAACGGSDGALSHSATFCQSVTKFELDSTFFGTWSHVAMTVSEERRCFYVNGEMALCDSTTTNPVIVDGKRFSIGASIDSDGQSIYNRFEGGMEDLGVWDRELNEEEILSLFNAPASVPGCTDTTACNFDPEATSDDGSCQYLDECGECGGPGAIFECGCTDIPQGDCDCEGNQFDALGVCGGECLSDDDFDGICDDADDCVGFIDICGICNGPGAIYECGCADIPEGDCDCEGNVDDECGVCNGPGAIYECGCADIPEGDCDCEGNQIDALGVCGGGCMFDFNGNGLCDPDEVFGCMYPFAQNYNPEATTDDGSCVFPEGCAEETACGLVYDGNNDGVVGSGDLLQLLTEFGQTCTPVEPLVCVLTPSETNGPFPLDLTDNPFFLRSVIMEDRVGAPLRQRIRVVGENNCEPLPDVRVHVWHCDGDGDYSGYAAMNTEGQTFCRGYQFTDANGECEFETIVPGWYPGRTTHMHLYLVFSSSNSLGTQNTWPHESVVAALESNPALYPGGPDPLSPEQDGVFANGFELQLASLEWDEGAGEYVSFYEVTLSVD
jgi:hypothetical protein